jgi:hypothetical protein
MITMTTALPHVCSEDVVPIGLSARELDRKLRAQVALIAEGVETFVALVREAKASEIHLELGYPSWPSYFVSVVGGVMPKFRIADRREMVAMLAGTGLSHYAISKALGIGYSTVARDLTFRPAAEREDTVGLDGKRYKASKVLGRKPAKPRVDRKAAKLQSAAQGLHIAVAEFLTATNGCSSAKARVLVRQVLGDVNAALGALEGFYEFVDQLPGTGLDSVGLGQTHEPRLDSRPRHGAELRGSERHRSRDGGFRGLGVGCSGRLRD